MEEELKSEQGSETITDEIPPVEQEKPEAEAETVEETVEAEEKQAKKVFDEAYVKQLRSEAASYRVKLKQQTSEMQKLQERLAQLEEELELSKLKLHEQNVKNQIRQIGEKFDVVDLDALEKLVDQAEFVFDGNGKITNLEKLVKELLTQKPYLVSKKRDLVGLDGKGYNQQINDLIRSRR